MELRCHCCDAFISKDISDYSPYAHCSNCFSVKQINNKFIIDYPLHTNNQQYIRNMLFFLLKKRWDNYIKEEFKDYDKSLLNKSVNILRLIAINQLPENLEDEGLEDKIFEANKADLLKYLSTKDFNTTQLFLDTFIASFTFKNFEIDKKFKRQLFLTLRRMANKNLKHI